MSQNNFNQTICFLLLLLPGGKLFYFLVEYKILHFASARLKSCKRWIDIESLTDCNYTLFKADTSERIEFERAVDKKCIENIDSLRITPLFFLSIFLLSISQISYTDIALCSCYNYNRQRQSVEWKVRFDVSTNSNTKFWKLLYILSHMSRNTLDRFMVLMKQFYLYRNLQ